MEPEQIKAFIAEELPGILARDPQIRESIMNLLHGRFAERAQTDGRFEQLLAELRSDREAQERKWEAGERKWEAQERKWEAQERKWEAQERKWEAQERKWEENQVIIRKLIQRVETGIGALGARWGVQSEASFRNGLRAILKDSFAVEVLHINEYDDAGEVFGRPEQVELDVIIKDGQLIIGELKSSASKADVYIFERKARFYERRHGRAADRLIIISPMVDERAQTAAKALGIEVYSYADDVPLA